MDVQYELAEICLCKQPDMFIEGMRELLTDHSYSYVKASFGKPDLLNQDGFLTAFSNRLPQKLHSDFFGKIADLPSTSKFYFQFLLNYIRIRLSALETVSGSLMVKDAFCNQRPTLLNHVHLMSINWWLSLTKLLPLVNRVSRMLHIPVLSKNVYIVSYVRILLIVCMTLLSIVLSVRRLVETRLSNWNYVWIVYIQNILHLMAN